MSVSPAEDRDQLTGPTGLEARNRSIRQHVRTAFDRGAGAYAALETRRGFFQGLTQRLLSMAPPLRGKRVLDVGCGSGASLGVLLGAVGAGGSVLGMDVSLGMLREAKSFVGESALLVAADGGALDRLFKGCFDAVVYNAVLFIMPDALASLESASRTLAPGGHLLVSSLAGLYVEPGHRPVVEILEQKGLFPGRHAVSPWGPTFDKLRSLFPSPSVEQVEVPLSVEEFVSFYTLEPMSAGLLPRLPYGERKLAVEEVAGEWSRSGATPMQVWTLVAARKPTGGQN